MKNATMATIVLCVLVLTAVAGCASTKITDQEKLTRKIPRPGHIWIYDFAATAADVPAGSALSGQPDLKSASETPEEIAEGKKLGSEIATELVEEVRSMGLPSEHASTETTPQINDIVIRGYLLSIQEGSEAKRIGIGFGSGASELKVAAEGFQMTAQGLRKLGSGADTAGGGKSPGMAVGVVGLIATHNPVGLIVSTGMKVHGEESGSSTVEGRAKQIAQDIAKELKKRAQEQGWIQ